MDRYANRTMAAQATWKTRAEVLLGMHNIHMYQYAFVDGTAQPCWPTFRLRRLCVNLRYANYAVDSERYGYTPYEEWLLQWDRSRAMARESVDPTNSNTRAPESMEMRSDRQLMAVTTESENDKKRVFEDEMDLDPCEMDQCTQKLKSHCRRKKGCQVGVQHGVFERTLWSLMCEMPPFVPLVAQQGCEARDAGLLDVNDAKDFKSDVLEPDTKTEISIVS